jgi:ribokinase
MAVVVFGSVNMDLVSRVPRLPQAGETLLGSRFTTTPGGKGANQAVAAAKLGVPTWMVGRVGDDEFGRSLIQHLHAAGVDTDRILIDPSTHSGVALITVSETGENQIVGVLGANGCMGAVDVERLKPLLQRADTLLLQLEISLEAVELAAKAARQAGVRVILDPAPVLTTHLQALYPHVDILVPNEVEASHLVGFEVSNPTTAAAAAQILHDQGVATVIIKLGAQGAFCASPAGQFFAPAFAVEAVDTVACGDAFAGGLSAALIQGLSLETAVLWGNAAGALAATQAGAQTAMPEYRVFEQFLRHQGSWQTEARL